jgi:pilus assembly protein TadC
MKILIIVCICFATYLWFPLPRYKSLEQPDGNETYEKKVESTQKEARPASSSEILSALEIIQLCVSSGMTISDALEYSQKHSPPAAAKELERGLNQFRIGYSLVRGLEDLATANPRWQSISDTLITSLNTGSPIADQLADVAFILQSSIDTEKLKRIKSIAVKSVMPLGLCFLPAFILLAVVPIIAGLIRSFN